MSDISGLIIAHEQLLEKLKKEIGGQTLARQRRDIWTLVYAMRDSVTSMEKWIQGGHTQERIALEERNVS